MSGPPAAATSLAAPAPSPPPEPVRLVIWDLDETFWAGTLSEGGITPIPRHADLIKTLAARGIVSSVSSKNDPVAAERALRDIGIWDHLVFPRIAFAPKGTQIRDLIADMQLRPPSVLFIDDNPMNLREAQHYAPGLQVAGPELLPTLADDPRLRGKPDPGLERLNRYKVLALKQQARDAAPDNTGFLRASGIRISFHHDVLEQFPRIHDLVNRTNQLNFTKKRWPEDEAAARAQAETELKTAFISHWGYVKVADRYGSYGICGFFLVRNKGALHFLFSCRAMDMGVEQFVWHRIGKPGLPDAARRRLDSGPAPDWIAIVPDADAQTPVSDTITAGPRLKICLRGGCDLAVVTHYLREKYDTIEEYQYPLQGWHIHRVAREVAIADHLHDEKLAALIARTPGLPVARFASAIHTGAADVYVLSFSTEIMSALKRSRSTGHIVPLFLYGVGNKDYAKIPFEALAGMGVEADISPDQWKSLQQEYGWMPFLEPAQFTADLENLFGKLTGKLVIVLMLNETIGTKTWSLSRWRAVNALVRPVAARHKCQMIELSEFVRGPADLDPGDDGGTHFSRGVYQRLAARIDELVASHARHERNLP